MSVARMDMIILADQLPDGLPFGFSPDLDLTDVGRFVTRFRAAWKRLPGHVRAELADVQDNGSVLILLGPLIRHYGETRHHTPGALWCAYGGILTFAAKVMEHMHEAKILEVIAHEAAHAWLYRREGEEPADDEDRVKRLTKQWGFDWCQTHREREAGTR